MRPEDAVTVLVVVALVLAITAAGLAVLALSML